MVNWMQNFLLSSVDPPKVSRHVTLFAFQYWWTLLQNYQTVKHAYSKARKEHGIRTRPCHALAGPFTMEDVIIVRSTDVGSWEALGTA